MAGPLDPHATSFSVGSTARICPAPGRGLYSVFVRSHVTNLPGTIHFVSQTPVLHVVGIGDAVLATKFAPASSLLYVAVLHQRGRLLGRPRAQIQAHQRFGPNQAAPGHELVRTELIRVQSVPGLVQHMGAIGLGSDSIEPVIAGDEISSGM